MSGGTPVFHREARRCYLGRDEPKTNRTGGKAREKPNHHPNEEVLLDNADAVIEALPALAKVDGQGGEQKQP